MEWMFLGTGILIGWITKIPWFLKKYDAWEKEKANTRRMIKNLNDRLDEKGSL